MKVSLPMTCDQNKCTNFAEFYGNMFFQSLFNRKVADAVNNNKQLG